jgi:hypothetical protein
MRATKSGDVVFRIGLAFVFASMLGATGARAEDKLLAEAVDFTGTFIYLGAKPPGLVIGAIRDGETVVRGFGEIADGSGKAPDGDTMMRIGFAGRRSPRWWPTARSVSPTSCKIGSAGT